MGRHTGSNHYHELKGTMSTGALVSIAPSSHTHGDNVDWRTDTAPGEEFNSPAFAYSTHWDGQALSIRSNGECFQEGTMRRKVQIFLVDSEVPVEYCEIWASKAFWTDDKDTEVIQDVLLRYGDEIMTALLCHNEYREENDLGKVRLSEIEKRIVKIA